VLRVFKVQLEQRVQLARLVRKEFKVSLDLQVQRVLRVQHQQ
jgi:hypothetical protein